MLKNRCEWQRAPEKEKGIIVGCDNAQEWLLPWWWERYSAENAFPVTFADFGMSKKAHQWCEQKGEVVSVHIDPSLIMLKKNIDRQIVKKWENLYGNTLWASRYQWFKKPFACLLSPYQYSVWIDLDCEILGPIDELFSQCNSISSIALVREYDTKHLPLLDPAVLYNGGVIAFMYGSEIISKWAQESIARNGSLLSDDKVLSALIYELQCRVIELPEIYNWKFIWGMNINAVIYHWIANGKDFIKKQGGIKPALQAFYRTGQGCT